MDEREVLFALKSRLTFDLNMGCHFVGSVDASLLHSINQCDSVAAAAPEKPRAPKRGAAGPETVAKVPDSPSPSPRSLPAPVDRPYAFLVPRVGVKASPEKEARLGPLREESEACAACGLCEGRNSVVWGEGSLDAEVMFVGEGPGRDEDEQGRPFVGRSGRLLTDIIEKGMKVPRGEVYITNVVKCRPPGNRDPKPEELAACSRYLKKQIEVVAPKVLVGVGGVAGCALLDLPPKSSGLRGRWHMYDGIPLRVIYHPSYLLRQRGAGERRTDADMETWKDIQAVMERLRRPG